MYVPTTCFACLRFYKDRLKWNNAYNHDRMKFKIEEIRF